MGDLPVDIMPVLFIIDDDLSVLEALKIALKDMFIILVFRNGNECLSALSITQPDIILTDYEMPGIDGLSLIVKILNRLPNLPILLYSARMNQDLSKKAIGLGAKDCLPKPFDVKELNLKLLAYLS